MSVRAPASTAPRAPTTNLAPIPTRFFGREADLARLDELVRDERRIVTLVGPGGAGKTRLARRFGEIHADAMSFAGGVWFCDLSDARDLGGVLVAVGHALDASLGRASTEAAAIEQLARSVAARGRTLLILDNCEQVIEAAARLVSRIAEVARHAIQITTSRESLRLPGEQVHAVAPLDVPHGDDTTSDAVRLFVDRAESVWPAFAPSPEDAATLAEIVRRLDGLPLAIELAAARVQSLSVETMHRRLDERFALLSNGPRFASDRQRTMRGAIDWSWNLLSDWEKRALADFAIFRGGFALDAAEAILDVHAKTNEGAPSVLDVVQSLCEKSLLIAHDTPALGERRYRMYESIRDYALEKLRDAGEEAAALDRHCDWFAMAGRAWTKAASKGDAIAPRERLAVELENLLAAHRHALASAPHVPRRANAALTLLQSLSELLKRRGPLELLLSLLDATLADPITARADATLVGGALCDRAYARQFSPGATDDNLADLARARAIARATGDAPLEIACFSVATSVELLRGDPASARAHAQLALARGRELDDPRALAHAYGDLGSCDLSMGLLEEARASLQEAIVLSRRAGDSLQSAHFLARLAETLLQLGRLDEASDRANEAMEIASAFAQRRLVTALSGVLGTIEYERGAFDRACAFFDDALDSARLLGAELLVPFYRALRGAALADADAIDAATLDIEAAEDELAKFPPGSVLAATVLASRAHLDLARGRAAAKSGDATASLADRARAAKRLDELHAWKHAFEDLDPMRRRLERALARAAGDAALEQVAEDPTGRADALVVAEDGQWFRPPGGARVDLASRPNLRRVMVALTEHRVGARGDALSLDALVRSGWPGDRAQPDAAANRARVALARLRKLGLGDLLLNRGGYLLDPDVPIVIARHM